MGEVVNLKRVLKDWLSNEHRRTTHNEPNCYKPEHYTSKGIDQRFLGDFIYKMMVEDALIHDDHMHFTNKKHLLQPTKPFPSKIELNEQGIYDFVGQVYDENDMPNKEYSETYQWGMNAMLTRQFSSLLGQKHG